MPRIERSVASAVVRQCAAVPAFRAARVSGSVSLGSFAASVAAPAFVSTGFDRDGSGDAADRAARCESRAARARISTAVGASSTLARVHTKSRATHTSESATDAHHAASSGLRGSASSGLAAAMRIRSPSTRHVATSPRSIRARASSFPRASRTCSAPALLRIHASSAMRRDVVASTAPSRAGRCVRASTTFSSPHHTSIAIRDATMGSVTSRHPPRFPRSSRRRASIAETPQSGRSARDAVAVVAVGAARHAEWLGGHVTIRCGNRGIARADRLAARVGAVADLAFRVLLTCHARARFERTVGRRRRPLRRSGRLRAAASREGEKGRE